VKLYSK